MFARSTRLALEQLDDRNAPSSVLGNDVATADWMPNSTTTAAWGVVADDQASQGGTPSNQKPVIVGFHADVLGGEATFSGSVQDENPAGLTVTLTGVPGCLGGGKKVTTDANGRFTFSGAVQATVDTGWAYADTSDTQGQAADQRSFWVSA